MIDEVIKYTRLNIHQIFILPITEFFSYYSFCYWKIEKHNEEVRKIEAQMRANSRKRR